MKKLKSIQGTRKWKQVTKNNTLSRNNWKEVFKKNYRKKKDNVSN